jgi:hypothetical protein
MNTMDRDGAIAAAKAGALQIQAALQWFEANEPSAALVLVHRRASALLREAETAIDATPGTIHPDGGTDKPGA